MEHGKVERATVIDKRRQVRLLVDTPVPLSDVQRLAARHLDAATNEWAVEPLFSGAGPPYLIIGRVDAVVGAPEYARRAHTLVQRLLDIPAFVRVEADLPVRAYTPPEGPGSFGGDDHLPGTEALAWAREAIRCSQAWQLTLPPGGRHRGDGILIGHPDSGFTDHWALGLEALALEHAWDAIKNAADATDPLIPPAQSPWPLPNPGHGTSTASVIAGRGNELDGIVGAAPKARLVPIRATESVVQLFDSDVARSIDHARKSACNVVSMSLGGKGFFGLREAIQRAVDDGMIVAAAAGNQVGFVVAPACYDNCIAVAATGIHDTLWEGSSRGRAVDVSAPGWSVNNAAFDWDSVPPKRIVRRGSGTSYAVAHLAGVAALWLAHHGVENLRAVYGPSRIQTVFVHLLHESGTRCPSSWDSQWGAGIVDAEGLLNAPLPAPDSVPVTVGAFGAADTPIERLSALLSDIEPSDLRDALAARTGLAGSYLDDALQRFEGELAYLLLEDQSFLHSLETTEVHGAFPLSAPLSASPDLQDIIS